jgi:hypothetical protein
MARFTLRERPGTGVGISDPNANPADRPGSTILVVDRVLEDRHGNQRGTFVFRGVIAEKLGTNDLVIAFDATNKLDKGLINTQGVIRTTDTSSTSPSQVGLASTKRLAAR